MTCFIKLVFKWLRYLSGDSMKPHWSLHQSSQQFSTCQAQPFLPQILPWMNIIPAALSNAAIKLPDTQYTFCKGHREPLLVPQEPVLYICIKVLLQKVARKITQSSAFWSSWEVVTERWQDSELRQRQACRFSASLSTILQQQLMKWRQHSLTGKSAISPEAFSICKISFLLVLVEYASFIGFA